MICGLPVPVVLFVLLLLQLAAFCVISHVIFHRYGLSRDFTPPPLLPPSVDHEHVWPDEPFGSSENGQMQNYRCTVCGAVTSKAGSA